MSLTRLALRNTRRQPRRSLLTALAIAAAVATATFMDAYMTGAIEGFFHTFVRIEAGHVKVMPEANVDRVRFTALDDGLHDLDRIVSTLDTMAGVAQVAPRITFGVLLDGPEGAVPAGANAVIPSRERGLIDLQEWVAEGRAPRDGRDEALLGRELAESIGMTVGDTLFFVSTTSYGGLGPGVYEIVGLFESGIPSLDRKAFYVPLAPAQYQLAMEDRALEVAVLLEDGMDAAVPTAHRIDNALAAAGVTGVAAVPWQRQGSLYETMAPAHVFEFVLMSLLAVIALTTVINTVLMSVMERTREIGALRALGFSRAMVIRLVLTESLVVGITGTVLGMIVGLAVSVYLGHLGLDFTELIKEIDIPMNPILYPKASLMTAVKAGLLGLVVTALAAWYPARVATRFEPAKALRST